MAKSITSYVAGKSIFEGRIRLDDNLGKYVRSLHVYKNVKVSDALNIASGDH